MISSPVSFTRVELGLGKASLLREVLVVEDSDEDFDTLCEVVQSLGLDCTLYRALSGDQALALLRGEAVPGQPLRPALILLDLNAPGFDGRDALAAIKSDDAFKCVPVVVLTTSANPVDLVFCYAAGANAYHVKPHRHDGYLAALVSLLKYWLGSIVLPPPLAVRH